MNSTYFLRSKLQILLLFVLVFCNCLSAWAEPSAICKEWFANGKVRAESSSCELDCSSLLASMSTFSCPNQCDQLCRPIDDCEIRRRKFLTKLSNNKPPAWQKSTENFKRWQNHEQTVVLDALLTLPNVLLEKMDFKIHCGEKSVFKNNPASTLGADIAIYDLAFVSSKLAMNQILAHELAHVYWHSMDGSERKNYRLASNWILDPLTGKAVPGRSSSEFLNPDGMDSIEEDFANNIEAFLFNNAKLKATVPSLFAWIQALVGDKFRVGGQCDKNKKSKN